MEIKYEIKGVILDVNELSKIAHYYKAACTAEYLLENYSEQVKDEETALRIGYEIRKVMSDYGLTENEAIDDVLSHLEVNEDDYNIPSAENGDYSPTHPWDAPGMSESDFI